MTTVTITFPDERTGAAHTHARFHDEEEARLWVYWLTQRFGKLDATYEEGFIWKCSSCGLRSAALPKAKVGVGPHGLTDLE